MAGEGRLLGPGERSVGSHLLRSQDPPSPPPTAGIFYSVFTLGGGFLDGLVMGWHSPMGPIAPLVQASVLPPRSRNILFVAYAGGGVVCVWSCKSGEEEGPSPPHHLGERRGALGGTPHRPRIFYYSWVGRGHGTLNKIFGEQGGYWQTPPTDEYFIRPLGRGLRHRLFYSSAGGGSGHSLAPTRGGSITITTQVPAE